MPPPWVERGGGGKGGEAAAAPAPGARGVKTGTRFRATKEAAIHQDIKQALVEGGTGSTTLVMRSVRNSERVYKNRCAEEVLAIEAEHPGDFKKIHHLVSGENYRKSFQETGDAQSSGAAAAPNQGQPSELPLCLTAHRTRIA